MWRNVLRGWGVITGLLILWGALANIAPDVFQIKGRPLLAWFAANAVWLLAPVGGGWLIAHLWTLDRKLADVTKTLRDEHTQRQMTYASWLKDRERDIALRCDAEYRTLEKNLSDFNGTAIAAIERFHSEYDSRLRVVEGNHNNRAQDGARTTLTSFLSRGQDLMSEATAIPAERSIAGQVKEEHCLRAIGSWEVEVCGWLKTFRPGYEEDFMANFAVLAGFSMRDTLIRRVECRLERLRSLKAILA